MIRILVRVGGAHPNERYPSNEACSIRADQRRSAAAALQKANRRSHADHARIAERTATDPVTSDRCGALVSALVLADDPELTLARFGKYAGLF